MEKPDLMAPSSRTAESKRILAQLEHGAKPPSKSLRATGWTVDGWTISLSLLLLVMCGAAWLLHKRAAPPTLRHDYSVQARMPAPLREIENVPAAAQVATIVNEAAPAPPAVPATPKTADIRPDLATPTRPATRAATAPHKQASAPAHNAGAPNTGSDTDVALLTALVAHAGAPASVTLERSRDVVERQEGDTTAQLLARCKQLGLIEGMLCRSRICSGRWENDAACTAPSH